jgi:hypothetical protein
VVQKSEFARSDEEELEVMKWEVSRVAEADIGGYWVELTEECAKSRSWCGVCHKYIPEGGFLCQIQFGEDWKVIEEDVDWCYDMPRYVSLPKEKFIEAFNAFGTILAWS